MRPVALPLAGDFAELAPAGDAFGGEVLLHALLVHEPRRLDGDGDADASEPFDAHRSSPASRGSSAVRKRAIAPPTTRPPRFAPKSRFCTTCCVMASRRAISPWERPSKK